MLTSWAAMASAVIGHHVGLVTWPVSLLMVCHARQLEWVKSIDLVISVHLSFPFSVQSGQEIGRSSGLLHVDFVSLCKHKSASHLLSQHGT